MQVLNAMLLACASIKSDESMASITLLLCTGAVPDTWAPNGSSVRGPATCPCCSYSGWSTSCAWTGILGDKWLLLSTQALMLAAAVDSVDAVAILLKNGATVELQVAFFIKPFLATLLCCHCQGILM